MCVCVLNIIALQCLHLGYFCVLAVVNSAAMNIGGTYVLMNYDFLRSGTAGSAQE